MCIIYFFQKNNSHNFRFMLLINNILINIHSVEKVQRKEEKSHQKGLSVRLW